LKRLILTAGYVVFHLMIGAYAVLLLGGSLVVRAQTVQRYEVTELERRINSMESLNLDHRLTVIETLLLDLQNSSTWSRFTMGGTGLLIAERVVAALRRKSQP